MKHHLTPVAALVAASLAGCVSAPMGRDAALKVAATQEVEGAKAIATARGRQDAADKLVVKMLVPYLAGGSIELASDASLPPAFKQSSAFVRPASGTTGFNINQVADLIGRLYGIRVRVRPDVFLPASQLIPGGGSSSIGTASASGAGGAPAAPSAPPAQPAAGSPGGAPNGFTGPAVPGMVGMPIPGSSNVNTLAQAASQVTNYDTTIDFDFTGSLEDYLKRITARLGISYEWNAPEQRLEFFRLVSRTYTLNTSPQASQTSSTVSKATSGTTGSSGGSGGGGGGSSGGVQGALNGQAQASTATDNDVWREILATLDRLHTPAGKVSPVRGTRTIFVMDTPDVIAKMDQYMAAQNEILDRQVALTVRLLTVSINQDNQFGFSADAVFTRLINGTANWSVKFAGAGNLSSAAAAGATYAVVDPGRQTNGSQVVVNALAELGAVTETFHQEVVIRNNKTLPIIDFGTFGYLSATTPASASAVTGGAGVPGLVTSSVTSGTMLMLTPSINSNESLVLSIGLDKADTPSFDTISTGNGLTYQQVQLVRQNGLKFDNEIGMRNGETFVLLGQSKDSGNADAQSGLLSMSKVTKSSRSLTVLLVTPRVIPGS